MISLADVNLPAPTPGALWTWVLCANVVASGAVIVISLWRTLRGDGGRVEVTPQPLEITAATRYATREEQESLREKAEGIEADLKCLRKEIVQNGESRRASIEGKVEAARKEASGDTAVVHKRVDEVGQQVAELRGEVKLINQTMVQVQQHLQTIASGGRR